MISIMFKITIVFLEEIIIVKINKIIIFKFTYTIYSFHFPCITCTLTSKIPGLRTTYTIFNLGQ